VLAIDDADDLALGALLSQGNRNRRVGNGKVGLAGINSLYRITVKTPYRGSFMVKFIPLLTPLSPEEI
jgi:hypothetical protein